jgi:Uma2 family endonuclease
MSYAMEQGPRQHRITTDEFFRMGELGLLAPDARVELIEGVIIDMEFPSVPHGWIADTLNEQLVMTVKDAAIVRTGGPVWLSRWTTAFPDFALLRARENGYDDAYPTGQDVLLVIEVSDSSLRHDLETKLRLYARYGVQEYWVVDINNNLLHACRSRTDLGYANVTETSTPGVMQLPSLDATIDLSDLYIRMTILPRKSPDSMS